MPVWNASVKQHNRVFTALLSGVLETLA